MTTLSIRGLRGATLLLLVLLGGFAVSLDSARAGTIVRVSTSIGDYHIELLDEAAPATVQNFLNYVRRDDFNQTYVHRVIPDVAVQGGAYRFTPFAGSVAVPADPPIQNEFGAANTRGTVAMAKIDGQPDSATSQWFVNLADNSGDFTVFGNVLGTGMSLLDEIASLPRQMPGRLAPGAPYFTEAYSSPDNLVYQTVEVVDRQIDAMHAYDAPTGLLFTSLQMELGGIVSSFSVSLTQVPSPTDFIFQLNLDSIILRRPEDDMASFSWSDNRLRMPYLEANLGDADLATGTNLVFKLTSYNPVQFTFESAESIW